VATWAVVLALAAGTGCDEDVTVAADAGQAADAARVAEGDAAAHGSRDGGGGDQPSDGEPAPPAIECFMGVPKSQDELLNQCWSDTITAIYKKPALPGGYQVGAALPAPPP
jgi:hypothetical protein